MTATLWRINAINTEGNDLELSALQLWDGGTAAVDAGAVLTCSHAPIAGALANLRDADPLTTCRWPAAVVQSAGFWLQWEFPSATAVTRFKPAAGYDAAAYMRQAKLECKINGIWAPARSWSGLSIAGPGTWYALDAGFVGLPQSAEEVIVDSGTSLSVVVPVQVSVGDDLLIIVMHRSALQPTAGWSQLAAVGPAVAADGTKQWITVLRRSVMQGDAGSIVNITQASAGRLIAGCIALPTGGVSAAIESASDIYSGTSDYVDALPITALNGIAIAAAAPVAFASTGGVWSLPADVVGILGHKGSVALRRLVAAYKSKGAVSGRFTAPPADGATTVFDRMSIAVTPATDSWVLREDPLWQQTLGSDIQRWSAPDSFPEFTMLNAPVSPFLDAEFGGRGRIYGTVSIKGTPSNVPVARRVRLLRSRDSYLARETWSKPDGSYSFDGINEQYEYDVVAFDHELNYFSQVANNKTPEVA